MPITCAMSLRPLSTSEFAKLDYSVMGHAFKSHDALGSLADETVIQLDFSSRLAGAGINVAREIPVMASFESFRKTYFLDLVVNEKAVYELKVVAKLTSKHVTQLLNYLHLVDAERGKLVNFGSMSVESRFVNAPLSRTKRQGFVTNDVGWSGDESFRELVIALLRDWGTGLELPLYNQAIVHLLGGEQQVRVTVPMQRDGVALGKQHFFLLDPESAFKLSTLSRNLGSYETQLQRLLRHSPLKFIHWINIDLEVVTFQSLQNL